ncbi:HD domain protein [mine drainage metagenome]|uniref:HD domain protein n=1 Tax=mine drainage metagenome TaxID=410659 RepID=A0A1J5NZ21_9ZZZZ
MHSLNVTILSMLLAKASGMDAKQTHDIGVAALLHDIGKIMLPDRIRWHDKDFTPAEKNLYETHVAHSLTLAKKMGCA